MKFVHFLLAVIVSIVSFSNLMAGDAAAGNIWYEYIGDSLNPNKYRVHIEIYQDLLFGAIVRTHMNMCISSSCFPDYTVQVPFTGLYNNIPPQDTFQGSRPGVILTPMLTECVDSGQVNTIAFSEIHFYSAEIVLPGRCSDFRFSVSSCCRRNYDNINNDPQIYLYADLNNLNGPNSSPRFVHPAAKSFCLNHKFLWVQSAVEPDGDSLYYELASAKSSNDCYSYSSIGFKPGYSVLQPFTTTSGIHIDPANGHISFTPSQVEVAAFNIKISEYRKYSGMWTRVGLSERGVQATLVPNCKNSIIYGPRFDSLSNPPQLVKRDSIKGYGVSKIFSRDSVPDPGLSGEYLLKVPVLNYNCFDSTIEVNFKDKVLCTSIAKDGSDFRLVGSDSVARPVIAATFSITSSGYTKSILLRMHKPLDVNGDYFLYIKPGSDYNTLISSCGFQMPVGSLAIVRVDDCPVPDYDLLNVSVEEDKKIRLNWELDSSTYNPVLFNSWRIYRAQTNGVFYLIDNFKYDTVHTYVDSSLGSWSIDLSSYQYKLEMDQNFSSRQATRAIRTILLSLDQPDSTRMNQVSFNWSYYDGWNDPHYEFFVGKLHPALGINWKSVQGPAPGFLSTIHTFPEITPTTDVVYAAKVVASNPSDTGNFFQSESNWVYMHLKFQPAEPDPEPVYLRIPNVFTPNGDGSNDAFIIESDFQKVHATIYNRWGKLVYEQRVDITDFAWNGQDVHTGKIVSDGVYYYIMEFSSLLDDGYGQYRSVTEIKRGSVTVQRGGAR